MIRKSPPPVGSLQACPDTLYQRYEQAQALWFKLQAMAAHVNCEKVTDQPGGTAHPTRSASGRARELKHPFQTYLLQPRATSITVEEQNALAWLEVSQKSECEEQLQQAIALSCRDAATPRRNNPSQINAASSTRDASRYAKTQNPYAGTSRDAGPRQAAGVSSHPINPFCTPPDAENESQEERGLPDDSPMMDLVLKLPNNRSVNVTFRATDRVGLVMTLLHGQGWHMGKHRLRRENGTGFGLVDYLQLRDAGVQPNDVLIVEPL